MTIIDEAMALANEHDGEGHPYDLRAAFEHAVRRCAQAAMTHVLASCPCGRGGGQACPTSCNCVHHDMIAAILRAAGLEAK